ncbi:site-specific integrase [Microcoleus sp. FACHB-1515]|uniref:tyrosine-type recombinase/integrase n=1 Tax=Cyanophyceae TaxID=3028117 RepID=UPI0016853EDB|nr:site-specific integrase [Microcoleus sp. FACHB-1515]MBD2090675.1 site-specific integrase [Microcoleus sp. FACHB-1515]
MNTSDPSTQFRTLNAKLPTGEVLPVLIKVETGIPVQMGMYWISTERRFRTQWNTLNSDVQALKRLYEFSTAIEQIDLDKFLIEGQTFNLFQIRSLAYYLRDGKQSNRYTQRQLNTIANFLHWCLNPSNWTRICEVSAKQIQERQLQLKQDFNSCRRQQASSERIEPLTAGEVAQILEIIGPVGVEEGRPIFSDNGVSPKVQLRNLVMFILSLQLGLRRGELLKLQVGDICYRGKPEVRIVRRPSDPHDLRIPEPSVKTQERSLVLSDLLLFYLNTYTDADPPLGRVKGKTPYLFVTETGEPLSCSAADAIYRPISQKSGVKFSWHSLRHTCFEDLAGRALNDGSGLEMLLPLGGWSQMKSVKHYAANAIEAHSNAWLQKYQNRSFSEG